MYILDITFKSIIFNHKHTNTAESISIKKLSHLRCSYTLLETTFPLGAPTAFRFAFRAYWFILGIPPIMPPYGYSNSYFKPPPLTKLYFGLSFPFLFCLIKTSLILLSTPSIMLCYLW